MDSTDSNNTVCPVCTLYLRPGITLKSHLSLHPKQKVIEALCRLTVNEEKEEDMGSQQEELPQPPPVNAIMNQPWNTTNAPNVMPAGNHVFIYQQSMSSTGPGPGTQPAVPSLPQQYIIPTILTPQMINSQLMGSSPLMNMNMSGPSMMPYVIQQQQVFMSSGPCLNPMRPIEAPPLTMPPETSIQNINEEEPPKTDEVDVHEHNLEKLYDEEPQPQSDHVPKSDEPKSILIDVMHGGDDQRDEPELIDIHEAQEDEVDEDQPESILPVPPPSPPPSTSDQGQPGSPTGSDWSLRVRSDLNKACQTMHNLSPRSNIDEDFIDEVEENSNKSHEQEAQTQAQNFYGFMENYEMVQDSHHNLNFMDMEIDFSNNHIISQVENFEHSERQGILMTIGEMTAVPPVDPSEESVSRGDLNIRADERMPPRGELSGQESIGDTSDITWSRVQYMEGNTYNDMMSRECWGENASDSSDIDVPPLQSRVPISYGECQDNNDIEDTPTIVSCSGPPLNFKCSACGDSFASHKDRKEHEEEKHPDKAAKARLIGAEVGRKNVKKLVIKPKAPKTTDSSFDFTNKLKVEGDLTESKDNIKAEADSVLSSTACTVCDQSFDNSRMLRLHKQEAHNIAPETGFKCETCSEFFPNDYKFTDHLKVHPLECNLCGKLFYRRQNLQLHTKRHLGIKPHKCEACAKAFLTKQKLDEHRNTHTGEAPIKCPLCDESFRRHSNLVQHRNRHHLNVKKKEKDYICHCKQIFHSKKKLAWHMETHDSKPKSCSQCNEKFIHMSSLTRHVRRAHNNSFLPDGHKTIENVECPICKGVYLKSSLEVHIRGHSGVRPFQCQICNKDFTTKWNLKLHKWTHASRVAKPFKCDLCKGAFIRESDYIAHMNSHKSVRPYTCNYCGARFIRKYNCQRHVKEHENAKPYACNICAKSFHRSYYLNDHMRIHNGLRPFSCHICGKTSATKSNHNKHIQIHHAREPVTTEN